MKNLILILLVSCFISSCGPDIKKRYTLEIVYINGDVDTVRFKGLNSNYFEFKNSDLKEMGGVTLLSGVRSYRIISIENLGEIENPSNENYTYHLKKEIK